MKGAAFARRQECLGRESQVVEGERLFPGCASLQPVWANRRAGDPGAHLPRVWVGVGTPGRPGGRGRPGLHSKVLPPVPPRSAGWSEPLSGGWASVGRDQVGPGCPTLGGPLRRHVMEGSSLGGQRLRLHLPDVITRARGALPALREELLAFPVNKGALLLQRDPSDGSTRRAAGARAKKAGAWMSAQGFPKFLPSQGGMPCLSG